MIDGKLEDVFETELTLVGSELYTHFNVSINSVKSSYIDNSGTEI